MARRKGSPKDPGCGRKKGTPNKRSQKVEEILDGLGFCALSEMFKMWNQEVVRVKDATGRDLGYEGITEASKVKLLCEIAQYQFPKRKAIEHTGEVREFCTLTITGG